MVPDETEPPTVPPKLRQRNRTRLKGKTQENQKIALQTCFLLVTRFIQA